MLVATLLTITSASAFQVNVNYLGGASTPPGGEFLITPVGGGDSWSSFCLEAYERLPGNPYEAAVSDTAYWGGVGPVGDPLSVGVAWLYTQFRSGTLSQYDYTFGAGRSASAWALQNAIWMLEDESASFMSPAAGQYYYDLAQTQFGGNAKDDNNGQLPVRVLNLTSLSGARAQDQLYLPDGGSMLALLGMSLASLGFLARKSR